MTNEDVTIEIVCQCTIERHKIDGLYAARFSGLGLTAYGTTRDEAIEAFRGLFGRCIKAYRDESLLDEALKREGITWRKRSPDPSVTGPAAPKSDWRIETSFAQEYPKAWERIEDNTGSEHVRVFA